MAGGQPQSSLCAGRGHHCRPGLQPRRRRSSQSHPDHPSKGRAMSDTVPPSPHRSSLHPHPPKSRVSLTAIPLPQNPGSHYSPQTSGPTVAIPPNAGFPCNHPQTRLLLQSSPYPEPPVSHWSLAPKPRFPCNDGPDPSFHCSTNPRTPKSLQTHQTLRLSPHLPPPPSPAFRARCSPPKNPRTSLRPPKPPGPAGAPSSTHRNLRGPPAPQRCPHGARPRARPPPAPLPCTC